MKRLYVLYDASCGLCVRCARWMREQPAFLEVVAIPSGSHVAAQKFPALRTSLTPEEVVVITDTGEVYRGLSAWLMCLYALKRYRSWAIRLSRPGWQGLARQAVRFLADHRDTLSGALGLRADFEAMVRQRSAGECDSGVCLTPNPLVREVREGGQGRRAAQRPPSGTGA